MSKSPLLGIKYGMKDIFQEILILIIAHSLIIGVFNI